MNAMLDDLILGWDVVNEDGTFPKTEDNIGYLFALPDKGRIFQELVEAAVPSRRRETPQASVPARSRRSLRSRRGRP